MEDLLEILIENPEMVSSLVAKYIKKYKHIVYDVLNELLAIYKDYANNTELQETRATAARNTYKAYVNVGFTEDQALALMINDNIQLLKNIKSACGSSTHAMQK